MSFDDSSQTRPLRLHGDPLKPLTATFCREKISGHGEDAEPVNVLRSLNESYAGCIAVFDGLGGAGSDRYTKDNINSAEGKTGARIAATVAREKFNQFSTEENWCLFTTNELSFIQICTKLRSDIAADISNAYHEYKAPTTHIRSAMRRIFPTTVAGVFFDHCESGCTCNVIWAGDSRVYALTYAGLELLTLDDVQGKATIIDKPMQMVDAPITNCIEYGKEFVLNHSHYQLKLPVILIAATDGCFGYLKTPVHFEHLLLDKLRSSQSMEEWSDRAADAIGQYAQDDYSMSITCCGWSEFQAVRAAFSARSTQLDTMIEHYTADANAISQYPEWNEYSTHYIARLKETSHGN